MIGGVLLMSHPKKAREPRDSGVRPLQRSRTTAARVLRVGFAWRTSCRAARKATLMREKRRLHRKLP